MTSRSTIEDKRVIYSRLCQDVTREGMTVEIVIFRLEDDATWSLSVDDEDGGTTVWDDAFPTESEALDAAMQLIETDGIASFFDPPPSAAH